jgi:hypothetical protein
MAASNINPAIYSVASTSLQSLSTQSTNGTVISYSSLSSPQFVQFPTVQANINNTAINTVANTANARFNLTYSSAAGNVVYQLSGVATLAAGTTYDPNNPITTQWVNVTGGNTVIGVSTPAGIPNTAVFQNNTGANVVVALQLLQRQGANTFNYPDGIQQARATITQVAGFAGA